MQKKKNNNLIFIYIGGGLLLLAALIGVILLIKRGGRTSQETNLGEQQRQQVREFASQLIGNVLDNQNNFDRLTTNQDGTKRNIDEIEEIFLSNILLPSPDTPAPVKTPNSLSPEVIEQSWYELRIFLTAGLQSQNASLLKIVKQRVQSDIEKWVKASGKKGDYNQLLEKYSQIIQEVKTVQELFKEYTKARNNLVINKVNKSQELIAKGYSEIDITQLKEWDLLDQDFPNLYDQERVGVTNALSALSQKYWEAGQEKRKITGGCSRELMVFLKPSNRQSSTVYFPPDKIEEAQQNSVRKVVKDLIQNSSTALEKVKNYDIYILRVNSSHEGAGPSSGVAHYLALWSALNKTPLPKNLASTATIEGDKIGAIGGLQHKLAASIKNGIDTFILAQQNESQSNKEQSFADTPPRITEKIKQVHFISQTSQIETALLEILKEPNRHIVHSCGKTPKPGDKPPQSPEPNPNSSITPEKLLSLMAEFSLRGPTQDQKGFHRKLLAFLLENDNFSNTFENVIELHKKYKTKIQNIGGPAIDQAKEETELNKLKKIALDFLKKVESKWPTRPISFEETQNLRNEAGKIAKLIKENKWFGEFLESIPYQEIEDWDEKKVEWKDFLEENISELGILYDTDGSETVMPDWEEERTVFQSEFKLALNKLKEECEEDRGGDKASILQEYETAFKNIASAIDVAEIISYLAKSGYTITKIEWTGKTHAPSLTGGGSVTFSLVKK